MGTRKYMLKVECDLTADIDFTDPLQRLDAFRALADEIGRRLPSCIDFESPHGPMSASFGPVAAVS